MNHIEMITDHANKIGLNELQLNIVLDEYSTMSDLGDGGYVRRFCLTNYDEAMNRYVNRWNRMKVECVIDRRIKEGQFTVINVSGDKGYAYTVGLTNLISTHPHELVLLAPHLHASPIILDGIVKQHPGGNYPTEPFEIEGVSMVVRDQYVLVRARVVKINNRIDYILRLCPDIKQRTKKYPHHLYQVIVADVNNVLPGEPGYDETLAQTLEACI